MRQHGEGVAGAPRADGEGKGSPTVSSNPVRVAAATHLLALRQFQRASGATALCAATQGVVGGGRVRRCRPVTQGQRWLTRSTRCAVGQSAPGRHAPCGNSLCRRTRGGSAWSRGWFVHIVSELG
jgi:hypothetical protein